MKGLAYVGALTELDPYYTFDHYIGTSAGAIAAVLLAAGYSTAELKKELEAQDFTKFLDANFWVGLSNGWSKGGVYEAQYLMNWLEGKLKEKLGTQSFNFELGQLPKRVTIYASQKDKKALIFDSVDEPKLKVAYAVRCSMSIPYLFTPQWHEGKRVYDGGLQNNYPIGELFRQNSRRFVGLYLGEDAPPNWANNPITRDLLDITTEANDLANLREYHTQTIVINPDPISTIDFSLNQAQKDFLVLAGRASARRFLVKQKHISDSTLIADLANQVEDKRAQLKAQQGWKQTLTTWSWYIELLFVAFINSFHLKTMFVILVAFIILIGLYSGFLLNVAK